MPPKSKKTLKFSGGGRVKVFYAYQDGKLVKSLISHENGEVLDKFPSHGHFLIKVTKALIKTSHPVKVLKHPNSCTILFGKEPNATVLTDYHMIDIEALCNDWISKKRQQIEAGKSRPVVVEKFKTKNVFAKEFYSSEYRTGSYKAHSPRRIGNDSRPELADYEKECNTANVVDISPPLALLYGAGYHYKANLTTIRPFLMSENPTKILIFYGEIYETTNRERTGDGDNYFSGITPRFCDDDHTGPDAEYESGIDGYSDDTSEDESDEEAAKSGKDESPEKKPSKDATGDDQDKLAAIASGASISAPNTSSEKSKDKSKDESKSNLVWVKTASHGPNSGTFTSMSREKAEAFHNSQK